MLFWNQILTAVRLCMWVSCGLTCEHLPIVLSQHSGERGWLPRNSQSKPQPPSCSDKPGNWQKEALIGCKWAWVQSQLLPCAGWDHTDVPGRHPGATEARSLSSSFPSACFVFWTYLWKAEHSLNTIHSNKDKGQQLILTKTGTK